MNSFTLTASLAPAIRESMGKLCVNEMKEKEKKVSTAWAIKITSRRSQLSFSFYTFFSLFRKFGLLHSFEWMKTEKKEKLFFVRKNRNQIGDIFSFCVWRGRHDTAISFCSIGLSLPLFTFWFYLILFPISVSLFADISFIGIACRRQTDHRFTGKCNGATWSIS